MSRPNSPAPLAPPAPAQWRPAAEPDARPAAQPRWPQPGDEPHDLAHGYPDPNAGYRGQQPDFGFGQPPPDPRFAPPTGHYARQPAPPPQYAEPAQAAQLGGYAPPRPGQPPGYPEPYPAPDPYAQGYPQEPVFDNGRGYAQQQPAPAPSHAFDNRGYDLGNYSAPGPHTAGGRIEFGGQQRHAGPQDWQQHPQQAYADPAYQHAQYQAQQAAYQGQHPGQPGHYDQDPAQHGHEADVAYDDEPEAEEEGRGGRRGLMIVGALVGAIALGGGLAYAYKQFGGGKPGKPPMVTAQKSPAKAKPSEPGGKEFDHTDKKLMGRLDESRLAAAGMAAAPQERPRELDDTGALKVRTIPIGRDGSMGAPAPIAQTQAQPSVNVPGVTLDNGLPQRPMLPPVEPRAGAPATQQLPPQRPQVRAQTITAPPPAAAPQAAAPVAPPSPRKPLARDDARAPGAVALAPAAPTPATPAPAATRSAVGAGGYVAVLSSQKSRMEALKVFADLQQKYGTVLQGKIPDVQEANLGDKGLWYRAVVGPPGSREAASGVCSQLKTAGYASCWVNTY